jgi:hypothetical protein
LPAIHAVDQANANGLIGIEPLGIFGKKVVAGLLNKVCGEIARVRQAAEKLFRRGETKFRVYSHFVPRPDFEKNVTLKNTDFQVRPVMVVMNQLFYEASAIIFHACVYTKIENRAQED